MTVLTALLMEKITNLTRVQEAGLEVKGFPDRMDGTHALLGEPEAAVVNLQIRVFKIFIIQCSGNSLLASYLIVSFVYLGPVDHLRYGPS